MQSEHWKFFTYSAMDQMKQIVARAIDAEAQALNCLSQEIWKKPELGFEETHAHAVLADFLESRGFKVERNFHLPTAFKAEFTVSFRVDADPVVCFISEYDALPEIGHACGHNLIAEAGVAAALGVKAAMEAKKIKGKLVVMGTPAEEGGGGKIILLDSGAFENIDFSLMAHPTPVDVLYGEALAIEEVTVHFYGHEAHAAIAPWEGVNALDAAVACYNNIALFRQQMHPTWRVHGIFTKGGVKPNIIPAETEMNFLVRAPSLSELQTLKKAVIECFEAAAKGTGCTCKYDFRANSNYNNLLHNKPMLDAYGKFAEHEEIVFVDSPSLGSTDMGNVTHALPSIHPYYKIPTKGVNHTKEFTAAAGAPEAQAPTLKTARCLALTGIQLLTDRTFRENSRKAFLNQKKRFGIPVKDL